MRVAAAVDRSPDSVWDVELTHQVQTKVKSNQKKCIWQKIKSKYPNWQQLCDPGGVTELKFFSHQLIYNEKNKSKLDISSIGFNMRHTQALFLIIAPL